MIKVNVFSEDIIWSKKIKKKKIFFNSVCNLFPNKYRFLNKKVFLTLLLSNNKGIRRLNKKFRNKNKSTDILSFPFNEKVRLKENNYLGDIIISYNFIDKPRSQSSKFFKEKLIKTFIHGFLHLLSFDHIKDKDYLKMLKEEELIYKSIISKLN